MNKVKTLDREKGNKIIEYIKIIEEKYKKYKDNKNIEEDKMLENLKKAHKDWEAKQSYFQSVTDPDLIDYAIYQMEASKLKYTYLLKKMRETNK